jgi:hypothetical protein
MARGGFGTIENLINHIAVEQVLALHELGFDGVRTGLKVGETASKATPLSAKRKSPTKLRS